MILPEDMRHLASRFTAEGLTADLDETRDPDVEDDRIKIFRDRVDTRVAIQISRGGGGYYVNEYRGQGGSFAMIDHGSFRSFRAAVDRAVEVVATLRVEGKEP